MTELINCPVCGTPFRPIHRVKEKYCKRACYDATRRMRDYSNNNSKLTWEQRDEIVRLYTTLLPDGTWMGAKMIAPLFGVVPQAIYNILRKHGVTLRDAKEAHSNGKRCKPVKNLPVGKAPLCRCGCEQITSWNQRENRWRPYIDGHYRPQRPYHDKNWLHEAYITDGRTMEDIAKECGVVASAVFHYAIRFNIPIRDRSASRMGRHIGEQNGAWKGGTTPERQRLYKAGHWQEFCQSIYKRDNFRCCRCGQPKQKEKGLHAHHLKSWAEHPDLRFDESNVISLCDDCHKWVHSKQNSDKQFVA